ncbi:uncharacterized protein BYT42DRAFT_540698 [Radiomyces spectabilis]|uniref:uncharacterized protein n=1 Tax=Radiomyces spectabilis TaxID=64574 RepID=UPI00221E85C3|nr:uncharacterized protein BYT42DRAFT_540698 [Radiomyces spectabilis]KAI8366072.1 hypothetical protein BYT42DRAFT_540698 [Radiomyces spectabilis]
MQYVRSPPQSPRSPDMWDPRGSKPISTSSRSTAPYSRSPSLASSSSRAHSSAHYESAARTYYLELKDYLTETLTKEAAEGVPPQRDSARQKLSRLNNSQFQELAMDVYDELVRRQSNGKQVPFLPVRDEFHPRRNQARQKLATLPTSRFKDLASDVFYELSRRYPQFNEPQEPVPSMPLGFNDNKDQRHESRPQPSHSTNIVPVMGMISVESIELSEDESSGEKRSMDRYTASESRPSVDQTASSPKPSLDIPNNNNNLQSLDSLMADLGNMVSTPKADGVPRTEFAFTEMDQMRSNYEYRIAAMSKRIQELEAGSRGSPSTLSTNKMDNEGEQRYTALQDQYARLEKQFEKLSLDHQAQQQAVRDVKEETKHLLAQLKDLSSENEDLRQKKDQAESEMEKLRYELKECQTKCENMQHELRNFKASSMIYTASVSTVAGQPHFLQPTADGAINHAHLVSYQQAADQVSLLARSNDASQLLASLNPLVIACKKISADVEAYEGQSRLSAHMLAELNILKPQFSDALTHVIQTAKSHAAKVHAGDVVPPPISSVDTAVGRLTVTMVGFTKLLGIFPATATNDTATTSIESNDALSPEEISEYLKSETDQIVSKIQRLLSVLRHPDQSNEVNAIITSIVNIVSSIIEVSKSTFDHQAGAPYKQQGNEILDNLRLCQGTLCHIRDTAFTDATEVAHPAAKRDLAKESYEIAKYTKQLIHIFNY